MKKYQMVIISIALAIAMLFAGCGESVSNDYSTETYAASDGEAYSNKSYGSASLKTGDYQVNEEIVSETEASYDTGSSDTESVDRETKLVYTCRMTIETLQYEETMEKIRALVASYDGFIENESERDSATNWYYSDYVKSEATMYATLVLRIPTENYDAFLNEAEGSGKVTERSSNVQNITKTYYETATTIQSLTIQEERLLQMMEEAKDVSEMLQIESRLTEVQTELAQYKNSLASMDTDVNYSTVTLSIREVIEYTPEEEPQKQNTFLDRLKNTFSNTWDGLKEFGEGLLFFLIEASPYLILFVVAPLIVLILVLKKCKKQRKEKAEKAQKTEIADAEKKTN